MGWISLAILTRGNTRTSLRLGRHLDRDCSRRSISHGVRLGATDKWRRGESEYDGFGEQEAEPLKKTDGRVTNVVS